MKLDTKYDAIERVICPACKGSKTLDVYKGFKGHTQGHVYETETCSLCRGEGIVFRHTFYHSIASVTNPVNHIYHEQNIPD